MHPHSSASQLTRVVLLVLILAVNRAWSMPAEEYRQRLEDAIAALEAEENSQTPDGEGSLLDLATQRLEDIRSVEFPGGVTLPVNLSWIRKEVKLPHPEKFNLSTTKATLTLYRDELDQVLLGGLRPETRAQSWAREIVSRREFSLRIPWIQVFLAKLFDALARFLFEHASERGLQVIKWALVVIGMGVVLGILYYLARSIRRTLVPEMEHSSLQPENLFEQYHSSQEWQSLAAEQAARGEFRLAVRCLYHGVLALLDEAHIIPYDKSRTNWEHIRAIRLKVSPASAYTLETPLTDATRFFERKWYGLEPCEIEEYSGYESHLTSLRQVVRSQTLSSAEVTAQ